MTELTILATESLIDAERPKLNLNQRKLKAYQAGYYDGVNSIVKRTHDFPSFVSHYSVGWQAGKRFSDEVHKGDQS
jgi:hypothetical protein